MHLGVSRELKVPQSSRIVDLDFSSSSQSNSPCFFDSASHKSISPMLLCLLPVGSTKKSVAKAMVYHHALACISSPQVYIISRRLYPLSQ